ncbi:MAG: FitA-like ribbon-helix-helix domain-containing protein [Rhodoferax sp.]
MPNISVKDVPEAWAQALRQRAARNHRSLQGELMAIIEAAVQEPGVNSQPQSISLSETARLPIVGFDRFGYPIRRQGWKTVEQVVAEMKEKYPEPVRGAPLGVDIIREDRDSR